ncbi:MAG TPA: FG-GAP repeat protein, partial [Blastocatellia bacterium]|nr:FG-GAP repeat protein [Blastocatellia bacterium]
MLTSPQYISASRSESLALAWLQSTRGFSILLSVLLLGAVTLFTRADRTVPAQSQPTAVTTPLPQGLTATDWSNIQQAYEQQRHAVVAHTTNGAARWQARNHAQQWLTHFDGRGVEVKPEGSDWHWGLELQSYGLAGHERAVSGTAPVTTTQELLSYDWDETLQEWYINDQRGLEHGFTVRQRPAGTGDQLTFHLSVRGGLRPQTQPDGDGISFVNTAGSTVLTYAGLKAFDADGRVLPARLEAENEAVRLIVETEGAHYPITIDPIAQQAYLKASNPGTTDEFGHALAISGDTVVVSARFEDSNATGINGDQNDNSATDAGAAYVF